jgi:hypothetical protein
VEGKSKSISDFMPMQTSVQIDLVVVNQQLQRHVTNIQIGFRNARAFARY